MPFASFARRRSCVALTALAAAAAASAACRMPEVVTEGMFTRTEARTLPRAQDCERCHQEVYREWEGSLHAHAFRSEGFRAASRGGQAEACSGCHAPAPVRGGERPTLREAHLSEGVTCTTCHLSPDPEAAPLTMRGPVSRTSPIEIHPIVEADSLYRSSELCGTCHEGALREWQAAAEPEDGSARPTCQTCHMPSVRRKMESVHDEHAYSALFVALGDERDLRRHTFDVPEVEAEQIELRAARDAGSLRVEVANRLPHALPTGSFGRRELRVRALWEGGEVSRSRSRRLDGPVASGETWRLELPLPEGSLGKPVAVSLERYDASAAGWRELVRIRAAAQGSPR